MNQQRNLPKKSFVLIVCLVIAGHPAYSQLNVVSNFVTASHHETNSAYTTQWAIGEIFTGTFSAGGVSVSNGLSETNIVFIVTDIETKSDDLQKIQAFPNPMTGHLTINTQNVMANDLEFVFSDGRGRVVEPPTIRHDQHSVTFNTEGLASGFYLLAIKNLKTTQTAFIKLIQQ
jgi:hypothetical protein